MEGAVLVEVWIDPVNLPGWERGLACSSVRLLRRPDGTFEIGVMSRQGHFRMAGLRSMVEEREREREVERAAAEV